MWSSVFRARRGSFENASRAAHVLDRQVDRLWLDRQQEQLRLRWFESILMVIMAAPFSALACVAKLMDAAAAALARGDRGDARAGASAVAAVMPDSASPPNRPPPRLRTRK